MVVDAAERRLRFREEIWKFLQKKTRQGSAEILRAEVEVIGASLGLTGDEALSLLLHSVRAQDAMKRKGHRYGLTYWQHTVMRAVELVGPVSMHHAGDCVDEMVRRGRTVPDLALGATRSLPDVEAPW